MKCISVVRSFGASALLASGLALAACGGGEGGGTGLPDLAIRPLAADAGTSTASSSPGTLTLAALADGRPLVVNVWATWCGPCRKEMPAFQAVHTAKGDAVRFVGVTSDDDDAKAIAFANDVGVTYELFTEPSGSLTAELQVTAMPSTLFVDAKGKIVERHAGALTASDLTSRVDKLLDA